MLAPPLRGVGGVHFSDGEWRLQDLRDGSPVPDEGSGRGTCAQGCRACMSVCARAYVSAHTRVNKRVDVCVSIRECVLVCVPVRAPLVLTSWVHIFSTSVITPSVPPLTMTARSPPSWWRAALVQASLQALWAASSPHLLPRESGRPRARLCPFSPTLWPGAGGSRGFGAHVAWCGEEEAIRVGGPGCGAGRPLVPPQPLTRPHSGRCPEDAPSVVPG